MIGQSPETYVLSHKQCWYLLPQYRTPAVFTSLLLDTQW